LFRHPRYQRFRWHGLVTLLMMSRERSGSQFNLSSRGHRAAEIEIGADQRRPP
jgi:hypothetical protein